MATRDAQPNFMNLKSLPVNTAQKIESDVLEPLTFSQSEAVWEFAPKGFLHPGTKISIGLKANGANGFPFLATGVYSLIRRAVLRTTAGRVICDTDSFNYLEGIKSLAIKNSSQKEREQYISGKCVDFEVIYDEDSSTKSTNGYGLSNGREYNQSTPITTGKLGLLPRQFSRNNKTPIYSVALHQLFPYLKEGNQLPLYMMPNERIQVVLFWDDNNGANDQLNRLAIANGGTVNQAVEIDRTECKVIADYVFFDGESMAQFAQQNRELTFSYFDYRLSTQSLNAKNADTSLNATVTQPVRNIGGQGMYVTKVFAGYENPNHSELDLLGKFTGTGMAEKGDGREPLESNLFMNSQFMYPQTITNNARQYHNLKETLGMVPFCTRQSYSGEGLGGIVTTGVNGDFAGRRQDNQLTHKFFYQGFLTRGLNQRVDPRGIDLHMKAPLPGLNTATKKAYTQRAWLEIRRYATIIDGHLECYYI